MTEPDDNRIHAEPIEVNASAQPHGTLTKGRGAKGQSARDKFIDVLHSRRMMKPGEEWVIDANLNAYAEELAARLRARGHDEAADLIDPTKSTQR